MVIRLHVLPLIIAILSMLHLHDATRPVNMLIHNFTLPRPLVLSQSEIDALTPVYCAALSYDFCDQVYLLYQIQESSEDQVVTAIHSVMGNPSSRPQITTNADLDVHDIFSRDIYPYAPFSPRTVDDTDPAAFFDSLYVHLSPREAQIHPHPHIQRALADYRRLASPSAPDDGEDTPNVPVPVSSLLTSQQAMRALAVSGVNVTVSAGILLQQGVSVWQVATYLNRIETSIVQNVQRLLSAVDLYDFTVAEVSEYSVQCQNGVLDVTLESDIDCGGDSQCVRCDGGKMCEFDSDCLSLQCDDGVCAYPR